ncbi:MAG: InlB B-repeat-containing protein [Propionibacteriaceae bacterium]|jgi:hypothetical protein|nr:InlB B-repeat-containing protein [Propionibacteriaceae bacterium]
MALGGANPAIADPGPSGSYSAGDRYYLLSGSDNFFNPITTGLLETAIAVPDNPGWRDALGGETITFNGLYKLVGAPEQDFATLAAPTAGPLAGLDDWPSFRGWLAGITAPRDLDADGTADVDLDADGVVTAAEFATVTDTSNAAFNGYNRALAFTSLIVAPQSGYTNPDSFTQALVTADTKGYDWIPGGPPAFNKLTDYHLTAANDVAIPMRFNTVRSDLLLTTRTQLPWQLAGVQRRPEFDLSVKDGTAEVGGKALSPDFYVNAKTAAHATATAAGYLSATDSEVLTNFNVIQSFPTTGSLAAILPTELLGTPAGDSDALSAKEAAQRLNDVLWALHPSASASFMGGFGAQFLLEGFYRQGIGATSTSVGDDEASYTASDSQRTANALKELAVTSKVRNIAANGTVHNGGELMGGNPAQFTLEITRPAIKSARRTVAYIPGTSDAATAVGVKSVKISDAGVLAAVDASGNVQAVGTEGKAARTVVLARLAGATPTPWGSVTDKFNLGTPADVAALGAYLDANLTGSQDVELLYTYAAADADPALVGEVPGDAGQLTAAQEKGLGAYATPLLRTVKLGTRTVSYNANYPASATAGDGAVPGVNSFDSGETVEVDFEDLPSAPDKANGFYTFAGWATSASAGSPAYTQTGTYSFTMGTADVTLYAVWAWTPTYQVRYSPNYPAGTTAGDGLVPPTASGFQLGDYVTVDFSVIPSPPTRDHYTYSFAGWATHPAAEAAQYTADGATDFWLPSSANVTLYAVWNRVAEGTMTVAYNANGGDVLGSGYANITGRHAGDLVALRFSSPAPTKEHATFHGWSLNPSATTATYTAANGTYTVAAADAEAGVITLYAVWENEASYSVVYNANYPAGSAAGAAAVPVDTARHYSGETVTVKLTDPGAPAREGGAYHFAGWSTSADAANAEYKDGSTTFVMPEHNVTLYAVWRWEAEDLVESKPSTTPSATTPVETEEPEESEPPEESEDPEDDGDEDGDLAITGSDSLGLLIPGIAFTLLGGGALALRRRNSGR